MRQAWVSGASGFVGVNVVRQLLSENWQVTALCRATSDMQDLADLPVKRINGELTSADAVRDSMHADIDTVFHIAADTSTWSQHNQRQTRVNVEGTRHVVQSVLHHGIRRMVHTSSFATWGFVDDTITEATTPSTSGHWINYIKSKAAARDVVLSAVQRHGLPAVILCPGHILGPYDRHNWARLFIMLANGTLPGVPPGSGAFADVREIARAQLKAADHGIHGEQFLLGGDAISYLELMQLAARQLGVAEPQKTMPAWLLKSVGQFNQLISRFTGKEPQITPEGAAMVTRHMHCDSRKAEHHLDYRQTPIKQLVHDTIDWLQTQQLTVSQDS